MIRLSLHLIHSRPAGVILIVLLLCLLLSESVGAIDRPAGLAPDYIPRSAGRHFYLTNVSYATNQAPAACAAGYHFASLWEILDPSSLTYDYDHPAAHTKPDSGFGPPSGWNGWVRTGYFSSNSSTEGLGNCNNWTSVANTDYGVSVRLSTSWVAAPGDIFTWDATSFGCHFSGPVWCVANYSLVYLPVVRR